MPALGPILVAGIGNLFHGDAAFGLEVVRRLENEALPPSVRVADFGTHGLPLAHEILDMQPEMTLLVVALPRGGAPGTVYLLDPAPLAPAPVSTDEGYAITPQVVLQLVAALGGSPGKALVVGCEPQRVDAYIGLSAPVEAAVGEAMRLILELIATSNDSAPPREESIAS